ncbi:hypothetical protein AgCh_038775 [Apium graveolens]
MTGDSTLLTEFKERAGPNITFGDDSKGYTVGYGLISKDNVIIEEVALVDGLKHNMLSINQLCDKGNSVTFNSETCVVTNKRSNKMVLTGVRRGNVYLADFNSTKAESVDVPLEVVHLIDEYWSNVERALDEDEDVSYVNLALTAKSDETETSSSSNQSLTKENAKIKENNLFLSERNNVLESQFIDLEKLRIECKIAKEELTESLKKEEILKKQLEREQEVIKAWKTSRDVHAQITKVQGIESLCDEAWKKNKEKLEPNLVDGLLTDVDSTDDEDYPSHNKKCYPSNDENPHSSAVSKPISKAKLIKLNEKYGSVSKNFVSGESSQVKKGKKANVGHMTVKQLSDRLEKIEVKKRLKGKTIGMSQFPNMNAMPPMPVNAMPTQNMNSQFANMPFIPNPYYDAYSMPQMPLSMPYWNNMFTPSMPFSVNHNMHDNSVTMNDFKGPIQMTKDESKIPESNEIRPKKQKKKANKAGPKETWVPKLT